MHENSHIYKSCQKILGTENGQYLSIWAENISYEWYFTGLSLFV